MSSTRSWAALTAAVVVGLAAAGWFLLLAPQRAAASAARDLTVAAEDQQRSLLTQIAVLEAQARELPAKQARLAELDQKIPKQVELPALLRSLEDACNRVGTELKTLVPTQPSVVPGPAGGEALSAVVLTLSVKGGFFQIEQLLAEIEALPRSFLVTGLKAAPASTEGEGSPRAVLDATITAKVFVSGGAAAPSPAGAAPAASTK